MFKKALIGAVAIALSSGVADAGENKFTKEEGVGMGSGAAIGAVVGGPIGAFVGLMVGGIVGDSVGVAKRSDLHAKQLEQELIDTRIALTQASQQRGGDTMLDQLAEQLHADVMFRTNSADIDERVAAKIEALGKLLAANTQLEIQLNGFADPRGTPERNLELSLARADAVREALMARPEPSAVLRYAELAPYDTEVVEACVRALGPRPHPALPLLKARLAAAR